MTTKKAYSIRLTDRELGTLAWLANRGYFPVETYDDLTLADGEPEEVDENTERTWELAEHAAWALPMLAEEDPDAYLACLGGDLLGKVIKLADSII